MTGAVYTVDSIVPPLLALQFVAFGWRINREIPLGDAGRRMWFPLPDILNILSMLNVLVFAVVLPMSNDAFPKLSRVAVGVGYELIAFHPITMAAHYRLWSKTGRAIYTQRDKDFPYVTRQEVLSLIASSLAAAFTARALWR